MNARTSDPARRRARRGSGARHVFALLALLALPAAVTACASTGAGGDTPAADPALAAVPATQRLYVNNQDDATVSIVDTRTNEVAAVVDLKTMGYSANAKPHHVAVEPDGSFWYVSLIGDNKVVKLDAQGRRVADVAMEVPGMMALHPTDDRLFVGRSMTAVNAPQRVGIITRSTMAIEELPVFFARPHAIGLNAVDDVLYTASLAVNQMAAIDYEQEEVKLAGVEGPAHALMQFALSPDRRTLVISGELSAELLVFDVSDPMAPRLTDRIDTEPQPFDPIFSPDGRWVILGNKAVNAISFIDMNAKRVTKVLRDEPSIRQPHGVALSPDGRSVYVSQNNLGAEVAKMMTAEHAAHAQSATGAAGQGMVVVIDIATQSITDVIEVGRNASGIASTWTP